MIVINDDPEMHGRLRVVYLENYRVSLAEKGNYLERLHLKGKFAWGGG